MKKLWFWVTWITLLTVLAFSSPVSAETYCLRNDGTAGSKTAATDCLTVGNCMDEGDYNGETFSASDVILVCPHGGVFDLAIDIDTTSVIYNGVYSLVYGIPILDEGSTISGSGNTINGITIRPGVAESGTLTFEGGRFAECDNGNRTWQAAEETAVTGWSIADTGLFAVGIGGTGGATTPTPQLYWRDKTDAGSFAAVGATGEVKYVDPGGCLTDEANLTTAEFGTSSGKTGVTGVTCEQENSHQATSSTSLAADQFTELQVGVSFADGENGHEYEFALYESAAQVGPASVATVSVCTPACQNSAITLFYGCENTLTLQTDQDCVSGENFTASDTSIFDSGINNTIEALKEGSYGCEYPGIGDDGRLQTNPQLIATSPDGKVGFWHRFDGGTWVNRNLFAARDNNGDGLYVSATSTGGGELQVRWDDDFAGTPETETTTGVDGVVDTWYFIEVGWDSTDDKIYLEVNDVVFLDGVSNTMEPLTFDSMVVLGDYSGQSADTWADNWMLANDETVDLYQYADDTGYATCN
jgi:hypothetical protein